MYFAGKSKCQQRNKVFYYSQKNVQHEKKSFRARQNVRFSALISNLMLRCATHSIRKVS